MERLRKFSLAAVAAAVLLGFAGAGSAQAILYTDAAKTIRYPAGTVVDLSLKSGTTTRLTVEGTTQATCTESTAKGKTAGETGETVSVAFETLNWGGCGQTADTLAAGKLEIKWTSGTSGEAIGRESQWTLGILGTSCSYGFGEGTKLGTIAGGEAPVLSISAALKKTAGNFLCPSTATLDAEYVFTEPHAIYVGS